MVPLRSRSDVKLCTFSLSLSRITACSQGFALPSIFSTRPTRCHPPRPVSRLFPLRMPIPDSTSSLAHRPSPPRSLSLPIASLSRREKLFSSALVRRYLFPNPKTRPADETSRTGGKLRATPHFVRAGSSPSGKAAINLDGVEGTVTRETFAFFLQVRPRPLLPSPPPS